ncbi:MAG: epimerase, partial [Acidobacteriota bacterium]
VGQVKGRTENTVIRLFAKGYAFRPGAILPAHGEQSKTPAYRWLYTLTTPLHGMIRRAFPRSVITTEEIARAMLKVARNGASKHVLESTDIGELARQFR